MNAVERKLCSIMEDRKADYLWNTALAAAAVGCHPNKFGDWFYRTKRKFIELYVVMPGETAAEFAAMIAEAEMERQRRVGR